MSSTLGGKDPVGRAPVPRRLEERLEGFIGRALADWDTPGLVLSVVRDDQIVLASGYGSCRMGNGSRPDEHTRFAIGSLSKAFGAASIACLVDRGELGWDDRVRDYLSWFALADPWVSEEVRIRDLLAHRVGSHFMDEECLLPVTSGEDFVRRIRHLRPRAAFRSQYVYSNGMYVAAGLLVEAVTGKSWARFTDEVLCKPLGMSRTTSDFRAVLQAENHATPHWKADGPLRALDSWEMEREAFEHSGPSGSIISTARDMAQWMRLQLGRGRYQGRQIISSESFDQMHTPHTPIRGGLREVIYWFTHLEAAQIKTRDWAYGLGWWVTDFRGLRMICHTGTAAGFRGAVLMLPEERIGVYVGVNVPTELPFAVALTAIDACLGHDDANWSHLFLDQARQRESERAP